MSEEPLFITKKPKAAKSGKNTARNWIITAAIAVVIAVAAIFVVPMIIGSSSDPHISAKADAMYELLQDCITAGDKLLKNAANTQDHSLLTQLKFQLEEAKAASRDEFDDIAKNTADQPIAAKCSEQIETSGRYKIDTEMLIGATYTYGLIMAIDNVLLDQSIKKDWLVVKEWGIKLKRPATSPDLVYKITSSQDAESLSLATQSQLDQYGDSIYIRALFRSEGGYCFPPECITSITYHDLAHSDKNDLRTIRYSYYYYTSELPNLPYDKIEVAKSLVVLTEEEARLYKLEDMMIY